MVAPPIETEFSRANYLAQMLPRLTSKYGLTKSSHPMIIFIKPGTLLLTLAMTDLNNGDSYIDRDWGRFVSYFVSAALRSCVKEKILML
jgi:hypothetical protein